MKKTFCFCKAGVCLLIVLCFGACSYDWDDDFIQKEPSDLSVDEARDFFEKEVMGAATRSADRVEQPLMWSLGDIIPKWNKGVPTGASSICSVDVPIENSTYCYRVIQTDPQTGEESFVKCYHKLVVVKDRKTGKLGNYVVFFIAANDYAKAHPGDVSKRFNNDGEMGDFSGLKIYTTLEGSIIRVNKYNKGQKQQGVFLGSAKNKKEYGRGLMRIIRMLEHMELQRGFKVGAVTRYEGNDDWDYKNGDYIDWGLGFFWDPKYDVVLYDYDGDGKPDGVWLDEVEIEGEYNPSAPEEEPPYHEYPEPDPKPDGDGTGDSGSGGGYTGGENGVSGGAPRARAIFRNSKMTELNWDVIERMLDKITNDCLGEHLYEGLKEHLGGKTLTIQFVAPREGSSFNFDGNTAGIKLTTDMESNQLFHEMMHAFQAYQETESSYKASLLNKEIEARYAQYQYVRKLKEYPGSKWEKQYTNTDVGMVIAGLEDMVDAKGNLRPNRTDDLLLTQVYTAKSAIEAISAYSTLLFDYDKSGIENFTSLQKISKDC